MFWKWEILITNNNDSNTINTSFRQSTEHSIQKRREYNKWKITTFILHGQKLIKILYLLSVLVQLLKLTNALANVVIGTVHCFIYMGGCFMKYWYFVFSTDDLPHFWMLLPTSDLQKYLYHSFHASSQHWCYGIQWTGTAVLVGHTIDHWMTSMALTSSLSCAVTPSLHWWPRDQIALPALWTITRGRYS